MLYKVTDEIRLPEVANPKYAQLSIKELDKGGRVIGGDKGDLIFNGFSVDGDETVLDNPHVKTGFKLTEDEVNDIALEILYLSYESIGIETVEHS